MGSFDDWAIADCTSTCNKGMVHMITMFTPLAHIDIGEYKNPFIYLQTTPSYPVLAPLCTLKISVRSQESCLMIPKKLPDDPKKVA